MNYDKIIIGSGLYGATTAYMAKQQGKRCLVLERRKQTGGNIRDEWRDGINVHLYGAHIFHTDNEHVWNFVNKFTNFVPYVHTVMAHKGGKMYHLPINLNTFYDVYATIRPDEVAMILEYEHQKEYYKQPKNLEEKAVNLIGRTLYELLVKDYSEKQWGKKAVNLSPKIITRLPIRETFDNRYFDDRFQGVPEEGYAKMINRMLDGIEIKTGVDFLSDRNYWVSQANEIIYTGPVDELMDYQHGELGYRSLRFETVTLEQRNYQGTAVVNETGADVAYTRTIEHKHFYYNNSTEHTIITKEYPEIWKRRQEPYYVINNEENNRLYNEYCKMIKSVFPTIRLGGRLGSYQYYDMDDVIAKALQDFMQEKKSFTC